MRIIYEEQFRIALKKVINYIKKDKISASYRFKKELKNKFEIMTENPYMYRASLYFDNDAYRDLTYLGYTVIYKIENDTIKVLDIFKWEDR